MFQQLQYNYIPVWVCALLALLFTTNCSREYSNEGRDSVAIIPSPIADSQPAPAVPPLQACTGCSNLVEIDKWSFSLNNNLLCGIVDTAIRSATQQAFTFYGPSLCSEDSGLVVTATLAPDKIDRNLNNYTLPKATMYYYDHVGGLHMLESRSTNPFQLVIKSYNHQTKEINGSFSGAVFTRDGRELKLQDGRWKTFLY